MKDKCENDHPEGIGYSEEDDIREFGNDVTHVNDSVESQEPGKPDEAVVVPQGDIDRLEEARIVLCELLGDDIKFLEALNHVTPAMYQITHRKYKKPQAVGYTPEYLAKKAYETTHEEAPPDVPRWQDLSRIETNYLIKFTAQIQELISL
jgi:hypothetical protein